MAAEIGVVLPDEAESLLGTSSKPALMERLVALALAALELVLDMLNVPDKELVPDVDVTLTGSTWKHSLPKTLGMEKLRSPRPSRVFLPRSKGVCISTVSYASTPKKQRLSVYGVALGIQDGLLFLCLNF